MEAGQGWATHYLVRRGGDFVTGFLCGNVVDIAMLFVDKLG